MDLSIIIVNWNSKEYLRKCLDSIQSQTHGLQFEIVVIDSASFDGSGQMIQEHYPGVRFLQSDKNVGFAKANNHAFQVCSGDYVLFLNPDTEVIGSAIKLLLDAVKSLPQAGVVGCKLLNSDGTIQTGCVKAFPSLANQFLDADVLQRRFPNSALWGMKPLFGDSTLPTEVDVISGACMMMRKEVFQAVGMFGEQYFMYSEDVELCFKARNTGCKNYYVPTAAIVHHGGRSTSHAKVSSFSSIMMLESRWRFFRVNKPCWYRWIYRAGMFLISTLRISLALVLLPIGLVTADCQRWSHAATKWYSRLRWTLGLERWVRRY